MERGRLDHIARSIPPEHSIVSEQPAGSIVLPGRLLVRRWEAVLAAVGGLSFAFPTIVGSTTTSDSGSVVVRTLGAGLTVLAAFILLMIVGMQWLGLRRPVRHAHRWILMTAGAWLAGMALSLGVSTRLVQDGQSPLAAIGVGLIGGVLMAGVTAGMAGAGLARMLSTDGPID